MPRSARVRSACDVSVCVCTRWSVVCVCSRGACARPIASGGRAAPVYSVAEVEALQAYFVYDPNAERLRAMGMAEEDQLVW